MLHHWTQNPQEAVAIQQQLAPKVETKDRLSPINFIAGVDIGFEQLAEVTLTRAVVVVLAYPSLKVVDYVLHKEVTSMPYVPGLLSFREIPAALAAFKQLKQQPDLVMVDGQGIAHPRRLGVASHLGLWLDLPTIGVAKKKLCGKYATVPETKGSWFPLADKGEIIGAVLCSKQKTKPLFISIGHRVCLNTAILWVNKCLIKYKLPEPTRLADRLASRRVAEERILTEWGFK